jgi:hypothetical protein
MPRLLAVLLLLGALSTLQAQPKAKPAGKLSETALAQLKLYEDTLGVLGYATVNDSLESNRFGACRGMIQTLVRALKVENSFNYRFDRIKSISILAPPDSSFRIFTWQLFVNDSTYRYYGAIQKNQKELKLFPLIDRSFEFQTPPPAHDVLSHEKWYGALYYNLRQFDSKAGRRYLLFGYDAFEFFDKRKVLEVLYFDKSGTPVFGDEVFDRGPTSNVSPETRIFQEYSAESSTKLNWDEQYQMVLMDHLIPMPSPFGRGITGVPDGSYDGWQLEKGQWVFVAKVFNDVMSEEFRPEPVLEARKPNDISGKTRRKRGKQ